MKCVFGDKKKRDKRRLALIRLLILSVQCHRCYYGVQLQFINPDVEKQLLVSVFAAPSLEHHLEYKQLSWQNTSAEYPAQPWLGRLTHGFQKKLTRWILIYKVAHSERPKMAPYSGNCRKMSRIS